jgi:hypothetical protein
MADSILLDQFSVKIRQGIWKLAGNYRLFSRSAFEFVIASGRLETVEPELLEQYREDFVSGFMPVYDLKRPNPYDRAEQDALLALLDKHLSWRPHPVHDFVFQLKFFVTANLLIPVKADELPAYRQIVAKSAARDIESKTPLNDAMSFEYAAADAKGEIEELAARTNNPDYAAKMLGYDRDEFGKMIHIMKDDLRLKPSENVIWHDDGSIEFRKRIIGNMGDYSR